MNKRMILFIHLGFALMYLWFGVLKFFPGVSPAEVLASDTVVTMSFHLINKYWAMKLLALFEIIIGFGLISPLKNKKIVYRLVLVHLLCTFLPFLILPHHVFHSFPYGFTLAGQYIIKNIVLILIIWQLLKQEQTVMIKS